MVLFQEMRYDDDGRMAPLSALRPYALRTERTVDAEALVAYQSSRYSVPPGHVGQTVVVFAEGGRIVIRHGDLIVAERAVASKPRSCVIAPEHLHALWQRTVKKVVAERHGPPPRCAVRFDQQVEQRALSVYAEVAG